MITAPVTFGEGAVAVKKSFDLTIEPIIRLTAGGAIEASKGLPLELAINDGAAAFTLDTAGQPEQKGHHHGERRARWSWFRPTMTPLSVHAT